MSVFPKLSIITAIHNGLAMNQFFWAALSQHTTSPFELVVVDNHSTDGSELFFKELSERYPDRVVYLRNEMNRSYPASQNQGMRAARADILCFLNNDIWMPKGWNEPFEVELAKQPYSVLSPSGQEAQPCQRDSDALKKRWKRAVFLSGAWAKLFRSSEQSRLEHAMRLMYGPLESFRNPTRVRAQDSMPGIKGDTVLFHRDLLKVIPGIWDERIEAADWHLYLSVAKANEKDPSIPLPRVLFNVYVHHFGRYTARRQKESFEKRVPLQPLESLWSKADIDRLWWGNLLPE